MFGGFNVDHLREQSASQKSEKCHFEITFYNDNDPKVCAWLRELIKEKLISDGEVDCRGIADV